MVSGVDDGSFGSILRFCIGFLFGFFGFLLFLGHFLKARLGAKCLLVLGISSALA
jgi:hypothetical protein